jgi:hypothetical protein
MRQVPASPYVYTLSAPGGEVFYVGKGTRGRMYQHVADAIRGKPGQKHDKIRAILAAGGEVEHSVVAEFGSDEEAVAEENRLLKELKGLTNIAGPRKCQHPSGRARLKASLKHLLGMEANMLSFYDWSRRAHRTRQDYRFYGMTIAALEDAKRHLQEQIEKS